MKKYITEKLNILKDKTIQEQLIGLYAIYVVLEAKDYRPQAIKRAIDEVIAKHSKELEDKF